VEPEWWICRVKNIQPSPFSPRYTWAIFACTVESNQILTIRSDQRKHVEAGYAPPCVRNCGPKPRSLKMYKRGQEPLFMILTTPVFPFISCVNICNVENRTEPDLHRILTRKFLSACRSSRLCHRLRFEKDIPTRHWGKKYLAVVALRQLTISVVYCIHLLGSKRIFGARSICSE